MDIKSEVKNLVVYAQCEEASAQRGNVDAEKRYQRLCRQSLDAIDRWADMANAAIALAEHQATSGYDPEVDIATYTAERGRLWDAFIMARAKAKGANNEPT